jgi:hypothetical protein
LLRQAWGNPYEKRREARRRGGGRRDALPAAVGDPEELGPDDLRVSFDPAPDEDSAYYIADHIVIHPDWLARSSLPTRTRTRSTSTSSRGTRTSR